MAVVKRLSAREASWRWWETASNARRAGASRPGHTHGHRQRRRIEASDLTLVRGDLRARPTDSAVAPDPAIIKGNLWAFAYNVAAIPIAASGYLNPLLAGAAWRFRRVRRNEQSPATTLPGLS